MPRKERTIYIAGGRRSDGRQPKFVQPEFLAPDALASGHDAQAGGVAELSAQKLALASGQQQDTPPGAPRLRARLALHGPRERRRAELVAHRRADRPARAAAPPALARLLRLVGAHRAAVASAPFARGAGARCTTPSSGGGGRGVARRTAQGAQPARLLDSRERKKTRRTGWRSRWRRSAPRTPSPPPLAAARADRHRHRHDDDDRPHGAAHRRDRPVAHIPATRSVLDAFPQLEASQPPVASAAAIRLVLARRLLPAQELDFGVDGHAAAHRLLAELGIDADAVCARRRVGAPPPLPRVKRWTRPCVRSVACAA